MGRSYEEIKAGIAQMAEELKQETAGASPAVIQERERMAVVQKREAEKRRNSVDAFGNLANAHQSNPEEAASRYSLEKQTGISAYLMTDPEVKKEAAYQSYVKGLPSVYDTPYTSRLLASNPINAELAKDDIPTLQQYEQKNSTLKDWWEIGIGQSKLGGVPLSTIWHRGVETFPDTVQAAAGGIYKWVGENIVQPFKNIDSSIASVFFDPLLEKVLTEDVMKFKRERRKNPNELTSLGTEMYKRGDEGHKEAAQKYPMDPNSWGAAGVSAVHSMLLNAPSIAAGVVTGNPSVALGTMGAGQFGQTYGKRRGAGFSETASTASAVWDAAVEVGTEIAPTKILIELLTPQARRTLDYTAVKVAKQFGLGMAGESAATFLQDLNDKFMATPTASMQERKKAISNYITSGEAYQQWVNTLKSTFIQESFMGGAGGLVNRARMGKYEQQKKAEEVLSELLDLAEQSKTRQRAPEVFEEFAQKANEDHGTPTIYVKADKAFQAAVNAGIPEDQIPAWLEKYGVDQLSLNVAAQTNGTLELNSAKVASYSPEDEAMKALRGDFLLDPNAVKSADMEGESKSEIEQLQHMDELFQKEQGKKISPDDVAAWKEAILSNPELSKKGLVTGQHLDNFIINANALASLTSEQGITAVDHLNRMLEKDGVRFMKYADYVASKLDPVTAGTNIVQQVKPVFIKVTDKKGGITYDYIDSFTDQQALKLAETKHAGAKAEVVDKSEVEKAAPDVVADSQQEKYGMLSRALSGKNIIALFEGANKSTFLHETGHIFLNDLKYVAENLGVRKDVWENTKKWLNIGEDGEITKAQHEIFAKSFEDYLHTGKAPTAETRSLFRTFKNWLNRIYKSVPKVSPEVSDIFDRLLATEEEIELAREKAALVEMLDDKVLNSAGLTAEEIAEYQKLVEQSKDAARDKRDKYKFQDRDERRKIWRETATREARRIPLYAFSEALNNAKIKITPGSAKALVDKLPKSPLFDKDGTDINIVIADYQHLGWYDNPIDFLNDLQNMQPKRNWIEKRIAQLEAEYENQQDLDEVIRNESLAKQLEIESKFLFKKVTQENEKAYKEFVIEQAEIEKKEERTLARELEQAWKQIELELETVKKQLSKEQAARKKEKELGKVANELEKEEQKELEKRLKFEWKRLEAELDKTQKQLDKILAKQKADEEAEAARIAYEATFNEKENRNTRMKAWNEQAKEESSKIPLYAFADALKEADVKISYKSTREIFNRVPSRIFFAKKGRDITEVTKTFGTKYGFATPEALVDAIEKNPAQPQWIKERVAEMEAEYDKGMLKKNSIESAMERQEREIHSKYLKARSKLSENRLKLESHYLSKRAEGTKKALNPTDAKILSTWADGIVGKRTIAVNKKIGTLLSDSKKLRRATISAVKKGEFEKAFDLNEKTRMTEALIRASYDSVKNWNKIKKRWDKIAKYSKEDKNTQVSTPYRDQINRILIQYGIAVRKVDKNGVIKRDFDPTLTSVQEFAASKIQDDLESSGAILPDWIGKQVVEYSKLDWAHIQELNEVLNYLYKHGRDELEGLKLATGEYVKDYANKIVQQQIGMREKRQLFSDANELSKIMRNIQGKHREYMANKAILEYIAIRMDRYMNVGRKGVMGYAQKLVRRIIDKMGDYNDHNIRISKALQADMLILMDTSGDRKVFDDLTVPVLMKKNSMVWTKERVVMACLNMGNESNLQRLMGGFDLNAEDIDKIAGKLTDREWIAIQNVWNVLNDLGTDALDTKERLDYYRVKKIPPKPFTVVTANGVTLELQGGYIPAAYDGKLDPDVAKWTEKEILMANMEGVWQAPVAASNFAINRKDNVFRPLKLSMSIIGQHIDDATRYIHLAEVIRDADRVFSSNYNVKNEDGNLVQQGLVSRNIETIGIDMHNMIRPTLKTILRADRRERNWFEVSLEKAPAFALSWNLWPVIQNFTGFVVALDQTGIAEMADGVAHVLKNPVDAYNTMMAASKYMRLRNKNFEADIKKKMHNFDMKGIEINGRYYTAKDAANIGFIGFEMVDGMVAMTTWWARYNAETQKHGDIVKAVEAADIAVGKTLGSGLSVDSTGFKRHDIWRFVSLFMSFASTQTENWAVHYGAYREKQISAGELLRNQWYTLVAPALLSTLMLSGFRYGFGGDDDKRKATVKDYILDVFSYAFMGLPGFRDIYNIFARGLDDKQAITNSSIAAMTMLDMSKKTVYHLGKVFNGDEKATKMVAWMLSEMLSYHIGIPASRVYDRWTKGTKNIEQGTGWFGNHFIPQEKQRRH